MKANIIKTSFKAILLIGVLSICLVNQTNSQLTNNPDNVSTWDRLYTTDSTTMFIHHMGYFTSTGSNIKVIKQGFVFKPVLAYKQSPGDTITYSSSNTSVKNIAVTAGSELQDVYQNTVTMTNTSQALIVVEFPLRNGKNSSYQYQVKIPLFNTGSTNDLVLLGYDSSDYTIDLTSGTSISVSGNGVLAVQFSVWQTTTADTVKVTYNGNDFNVKVYSSTAFRFAIGISGSGSQTIALSTIQVILNVNGAVVYTDSGDTNCGSGIACVNQYVCTGTNCLG